MSYPRRQAFVIAALEDIQAQFGCVSESSQRILAAHFNMEMGELESLMAHCADAFSAAPARPRAVTLCQGPVCMAHGAGQLCQELNEQDVDCELHICLGACDRAPAARCGRTLIAPADAAAITRVI